MHIMLLIQTVRLNNDSGDHRNENILISLPIFLFSPSKDGVSI